MKNLSKFLTILLFISASAFADNDERKIIMGGSAVGIRDSSKQDTEITFNAALSDLLKSHGANLTVKIFDSTKDLYQAFDNNEIDGIFGTPLEYVQRESKMKNIVIAVHYKNVALAQPLLMLVRADDDIKSMKDLRTKKYSLSPTQDMEMLYLNTTLLENQLSESDTFFSERLTPKNTNTGMMDVFFGKSDLTIVRESEYKIAIELNPQLAKKLKVLAKSEPFLVLVGGARNNMSDKSHATAYQSLIDLSTTEKGQQLMKIIHAESFDPVTTKELNSARDMLKRYQLLKAQAASRSKPQKPSKQAKN